MNEPTKESLLVTALAAAPGPAPAEEEDKAWLRSVNETSAALLIGSAPRVHLPAGAWSGIQSVISSRKTAATRQARVQKLLLWGGWAAAACLALLWALQHRSTAPSPGGVVTSGHRSGENTAPGTDKQPADGGGGASGNSMEAADTKGLPRSLREQLRGSRDYQLVQSVDTLRGEVSRLRAADAERYTPRNGVSRIVVMELGEARRKTTTPSRLSSDKLSDIVAAGLSGTSSSVPGTDTPPDPSATEKRPITLRPGDTWDGEFVVPAGDPLPDFSLLNLPAGVSIRYGSLPLNDPQWAENFHAVSGKENMWYDQRNDVVWSPSEAHPGEFTGRRPGSEFNRDLFQYADSAAGNTHPPAGQVHAAESTGSGAPLSAWTIYDETSGKGSIIVSDLDPAPAGMTYRLSFEDAAHGSTVTVGDLPSLEDGGGRVYFDLGVPGYSPSKYKLDLVSQNASTPVLQGPGGN